MSDLFDPPPPTKYNVLNLGAGVQSSTLALMTTKGFIKPIPDFAVFADTQAEPQSVYEWLEWLKNEVNFPIHTVTKGNLTVDSLKPTKRKRGNENEIGQLYMKRLIPLFGIMPDGRVTAAIGRKCTADYKIVPIIKKIREECKIKRGQKDVTVTQWIGISWDEIQRMKDSSHPWTQHRFPLIEKKITRAKCHEWLKENNYPSPPRSACYYCPFHSDIEWRNLRDKDPDFFEKAVKFDKNIRHQFKQNDPTMKMEVYLHKSCKPLDEVDFDSDEDKGQMVFDFQSECSGMCGI